MIHILQKWRGSFPEWEASKNNFEVVAFAENVKKTECFLFGPRRQFSVCQTKPEAAAVTNDDDDDDGDNDVDEAEKRVQS